MDGIEQEKFINKKQRLDWLDAAKAIGIYLVILGHLVIFNYKVFRFIFAFHMPFFFLAAGYVWKEQESFSCYFKKCCNHYLLPYLIAMILGLFQCVFLPLPGHTMETLLNRDVLQESFYDGLPGYSFFGSSWFLIAMFLAQLLFYGLVKFREKSKKYITVLVWITFTLFALFSNSIFEKIPVFGRLPFKLDSAFMATVFIGIGVLFRKSGIFEKKKWYLSVGFMVVGGLFTWLFGCKLNYYVNLSECIYGREYHYLFAAVAGSIMLFGIGQILRNSKFIRFIGQNTLFIFLAHEAIYTAVIHYVNLWFGKEFAGQSMQLDGWSIGISFATLMIATLFAWIFKRTQKAIRSKIDRRKNMKCNEGSASS